MEDIYASEREDGGSHRSKGGRSKRTEERGNNKLQDEEAENNEDMTEESDKGEMNYEDREGESWYQSLKQGEGEGEGHIQVKVSRCKKNVECSFIHEA